MLVRKEAIRPGVYYYDDPDTGLPRKLDVTADGVKYFFEQGKAMLDAGLSIPVPLEHQPLAKAMTRAEKAATQLLNNAGWVTKYEMDPGDVLMSVLDIQDPEVAKKLPHTIKWTSPWINSFTDGDGKRWDGVISHLALTTRPRIHRQSPFPTVAAAMSYAGAIPLSLTLGKTPPAHRGVALSRAGLLKADGAVLSPVYPIAFSLFSGVALAEEMVKEKKKEVVKPDEPPTDKPPVDQPPVPGMGPPAEEALVDGDGDISIHTVLADLLHTIEVELEEGTTAENFMERLYKALMEKCKGMKKTDDPLDKPMDKPADKPAASPVVQEQGPMYMSLEQIAAIADPQTKAMASMLFSLQNNVLEQAKTSRMTRIERLAKRLKPDVKAKLLALIADPGAQFSLSNDGKVNDPLDAWLSMLEATAVDMPALVNGQALSLPIDVQPHPTDYSGEVSPERVAEVRAELARNAGVPQKKAS